MLPETKGSDYRILAAGTEGYIDMSANSKSLIVTNPDGDEVSVVELPEKVSVVENWLNGDGLVPQEASLRANRLALLATISAREHKRIGVC